MDEYESLSHTTWTCKYHVVFIPKGRRKALYQELRRHLGEVFRKLALHPHITNIQTSWVKMGPRACCFWDESEGDSRIGEILIQPAGWAEASRRWQRPIRKTCAIV